jgi:transcriptional antiterminator NusG
MFAEEINEQTSHEEVNSPEEKGLEEKSSEETQPEKEPALEVNPEAESSLIRETVPAKETAPEVQEPAAEVQPEAKKWYVIQTFSGQEDKVKVNLEHAIKDMNMGHKIFKVLVPEEETIEVRGKQKIEKKKKMFPGYVFIEMLLDEESWYVIRSTPGVAKFIGTKIQPTPVLDAEMQRVLKQIGVKEERLEVNFEIGETLRVISGPFRGYTGTINEINADKGRLKVLINIFGRDTPVEVNFEHTQKIV